MKIATEFKMVSLEINLIKEIVDLGRPPMIITFGCAMAIVSFISAFYTKPEAWGIDGINRYAN